MKPHSRLSLAAGFALAGFAFVAQAESVRSPGVFKATPVITSHEFVVVGEVVARNEVGFTVLSEGSELRTITINRFTSIKKGAESIRLVDVMIGDKVSVTLMRAADGQLQAVNVAVRTGFEPRLGS